MPLTKSKNRSRSTRSNVENQAIAMESTIKTCSSNSSSSGSSRGRRRGWFHSNRRKLFFGMVAAIVLFQVHQVVVLDSKKTLEVQMSSSMIRKDYSDIVGLDDLQRRSALITELCYPGMEDSCQCEDPMVGKGRQGQRHWSKASHENKDSISTIKDGADVVFYGDSITEGWKGTSYGFPNGRKDNNYAVFKSLFSTEGGGKFDGILMGISGDRSPDLLWRLKQGGELPQSLNVPVIWLLIGTNDMGWAWCSPEVTLIGILRVVEELLIQKPGSTIVINGLLPRSFDRKRGYLMRSTSGGKAGGFGAMLHKLGKRGFSEKNPPPLWKNIQEINLQLEEYSRKRDNVEYFDGSDIFIKDVLAKEKDLRIDGNLMEDYLHPSALGYKLLGGRIVSKLEQLI